MNLPTVGMTVAGDTIPVTELAGLSASVTAAWTDTCDLWRRDPTAKNAEGGPASGFPAAWNQIGFAVPCHLYKVTKESETVAAGGVTSLSYWQLELLLGTDAQGGDLVEKDAMRFDYVDDDKGKSNALVLTAVVSRRNR